LAGSEWAQGNEESERKQQRAKRFAEFRERAREVREDDVSILLATFCVTDVVGFVSDQFRT
jgi:hypothetical protein